MKLAVVGSRNWHSLLLYDVLAEFHAKTPITVLVSGGANGADRMAESWADGHGILTGVYPAEWDKYGKSAGYKRNVLIVDNADAVMAFVVPVLCAHCESEWKDCKRCSGRGWLPTKGTAHSLALAVKANKPTWVVTPDGKQHEWCKGE